MLIPLAVAGGAALGAPCRYLVDQAVQVRHDQRFPWGTVLVNLIGSVVLGVLLGWSTGLGAEVWSRPAGGSPALLAAVGTGWCGAFTTYSTFGYETVLLARDGFALRAAGNVAVTLVGGLAMAALGVLIGRALSG